MEDLFYHSIGPLPTRVMAKEFYPTEKLLQSKCKNAIHLRIQGTPHLGRYYTRRQQDE
jgi:hypothetical protein